MKQAPQFWMTDERVFWQGNRSLLSYRALRDLADRLERLDFSLQQWVLLSTLEAMEPCPLKTLVARMGGDMGGVSRMIGKLQGLGLVLRKTSPSNRRAVSLSLTKEGRKVLAVLKKEAEKSERAFFESKSAGINHSQTPERRIALFSEMALMDAATSRFGAQLFHELMNIFAEAGYTTRLYFGGRRPESRAGDAGFDGSELFADIEKGEICGVASFFLPNAGKDRFANMMEKGIPLIECGTHMPPFTGLVTVPYERWFESAIQYMAKMGKKRPAIVYWAHHSRFHEKYLGLFEGMVRKYGMEFHPEWVKWEFHPNIEGAGWSEMREIWTRFKDVKPDSLIIGDDILTPGVCRALAEMDVDIPSQTSVLSYANSGCPLSAPVPVTVLEYDTVSHAKAVGDLMLPLLRGEQVENLHRQGSDRFALRTIEPYSVGNVPISTQGKFKTSQGMPVTQTGTNNN